MNPIVKNILAVIAGVVLGSAVNQGIIMISGSIIPPPEGVDATTMEGLKESMHLFEPRHFIFPFLAHAIGTFVGALIVSLIATSHKMIFALGIGLVFLLGGITMAVLVPSPTWFIILDLVGAYLPMAFFGNKIAQGFNIK